MIAADEDQPALEVFYTTLKQCKIILVQHVNYPATTCKFSANYFYI